MLTQQGIWEADRCFQHVCRMIRMDGILPVSVLFGSTFSSWLEGSMKIIVICEPPSANYKRATITVTER